MYPLWFILNSLVPAGTSRVRALSKSIKRSCNSKTLVCSRLRFTCERGNLSCSCSLKITPDQWSMWRFWSTLLKPLPDQRHLFLSCFLRFYLTKYTSCVSHVSAMCQILSIPAPEEASIGSSKPLVILPSFVNTWPEEPLVFLDEIFDIKERPAENDACQICREWRSNERIITSSSWQEITNVTSRKTPRDKAWLL